MEVALAVLVLWVRDKRQSQSARKKYVNVFATAAPRAPRAAPRPVPGSVCGLLLRLG